MTAPDLDALERLRAEAPIGSLELIGMQGTAIWRRGERMVASMTYARESHREARADAALIVAAVNALPALIAELRAARQDAARYRWLRANAWLPEWAFSASSPDAEDAAIDAAIAKGGPT